MLAIAISGKDNDMDVVVKGLPIDVPLHLAAGTGSNDCRLTLLATGSSVTDTL
jgi:hypothetical protein